MKYNNDKPSEKEILSWIEMHKTMPIVDISKITKRNTKTITKWLKRSNISIKIHRFRSQKIQDEEFKILYEKYLKNKRLNFINFCKSIDLNRSSCLNMVKKLNLELKGELSKHKDINDNFFSDIDTEIKAYLLGFFAADGHIEKRKDYYTYCLKIGIHKKDVEILNLFNKYVANNLCLINYPKTKPTMCTLSIHSTQIGEDLLKMGYDNRKTYTCKSIPKIRKDLIRHFIRGFFDGDGSVIVNKRKQGYNRTFNICSFNVELVEEIFSYFNITKNKIYKQRIKSSEKVVNGNKTIFQDCYSYQIKDVINFEKIFYYLYNDSNFFLERKYNKYKEGIKYYMTPVSEMIQ